MPPDILHLRRITTILDALHGQEPTLTLPYAIVALEDALVCLHLAYKMGLSFQMAVKDNAEICTHLSNGQRVDLKASAN